MKFGVLNVCQKDRISRSVMDSRSKDRSRTGNEKKDRGVFAVIPWFSWYARQDSNLRPTDSKSDELSG